MAWCPECKTEYEDGVVNCSDCDSTLVEQLPEDSSDVSDESAEENNEIEDLEYLKYSDNPLLIKNLLDEEGIECSLVDHRISLYSEDFDRAVEFLEAYFNSAPVYDESYDEETIEALEDPTEIVDDDKVEQEKEEEPETDLEPDKEDEADEVVQDKSKSGCFPAIFTLTIAIGSILFLIFWR